MIRSVLVALFAIVALGSSAALAQDANDTNGDGAVNCDDFGTYDAALAAIAAGDAYGLDADGDGQPCETFFGIGDGDGGATTPSEGTTGEPPAGDASAEPALRMFCIYAWSHMGEEAFYPREMTSEEAYELGQSFHGDVYEANADGTCPPLEEAVPYSVGTAGAAETSADEAAVAQNDDELLIDVCFGPTVESLTQAEIGESDTYLPAPDYAMYPETGCAPNGPQGPSPNNFSCVVDVDGEDAQGRLLGSFQLVQSIASADELAADYAYVEKTTPDAGCDEGRFLLYFVGGAPILEELGDVGPAEQPVPPAPLAAPLPSDNAVVGGQDAAAEAPQGASGRVSVLPNTGTGPQPGADLSLPLAALLVAAGFAVPFGVRRR